MVNIQEETDLKSDKDESLMPSKALAKQALSSELCIPILKPFYGQQVDNN
jgi:hypothetical protein